VCYGSPAFQTPARELVSALTVGSIGYLVPRARFAGHVHSVFARACNIASDDGLLTVASSALGDGPATLRLTPGACDDLRRCYEAGEDVRGDGVALRTARTTLRHAGAPVWRPSRRRPWLAGACIEERLQRAQARVDARLARAASVLAGSAAACVSTLVRACNTLDAETALQQAARLIGWGEGLTPAGDDFLAGLLAGLDAFDAIGERRRRLRAALAEACVAGAARTTPISAHALRLAAGGHHAHDLLALRDALLCDEQPRVDRALERTLGIGATSGAASARGIVSALRAWSGRTAYAS
jgi:hypothetical protein